MNLLVLMKEDRINLIHFFFFSEKSIDKQKDMDFLSLIHVNYHHVDIDPKV